jgi:septal ring factor EnvC (AmiA/AmiB activator)
MNFKTNQQWTSQISGKNKAKYEKQLENKFIEITKFLKAQSVVAVLLSYDWDAIRKFNKSIRKCDDNDTKLKEEMEEYKRLCNQINDEISKSRKEFTNQQVQIDVLKMMNAEACQ